MLLAITLAVVVVPAAISGHCFEDLWFGSALVPVVADQAGAFQSGVGAQWHYCPLRFSGLVTGRGTAAVALSLSPAGESVWLPRALYALPCDALLRPSPRLRGRAVMGHCPLRVRQGWQLLQTRITTLLI